MKGAKTRDSTQRNGDESGAPDFSTAEEGGAGAGAPPLQKQSPQINDPTRRKQVQLTIKRSANYLLETLPLMTKAMMAPIF